MERLGLTYDVVRGWNPRLTMISSTGCGQTGPWNTYRGTGGHFESFYGHSSVIGYPDMDVDGIPATVASDATTGVTIALAALLSLVNRERTGEGVFVDIAMGENFLPHLGELVMDYTINGRSASSLGNRDLHLVQGCYPCSGDNEWIVISLGTLEQWQSLCHLMGKDELVSDSRFSSLEDLRHRHDDVDEIIASWTAQQDPIQVFAELQKSRIPSGPVLHEAHAYADPHARDRDFFVSITQADTGTHLYPTGPYKLPKAPFEVRKPPVRLGEDNDYIYREVLKLSEEEYDKLKERGHIGTDYAAHLT